MGFDGCLGQVKSRGDLAVGEAVGDLQQHLTLARRERLEVRLGIELVLGVEQTADGRRCRAGAGSRWERPPRRRSPPPGCQTVDRWGGRPSRETRSRRHASAAWAYSSRSKVVRISTRDGSPCSMIRRVASIPSMPGMRTSISTTSGVELGGELERLATVRRLPDHRHVQPETPAPSETPAEERLIVSQQYGHAHRVSRSGGSTISRACTRQPPSGAGPASTVPPNTAAR